MTTFALAFDLLMTAWPALFAVLFPARPRASGSAAAALHRRLALLLAATLAGVAIVLLGHRLASRPIGLWALCFPLWWLSAMPALRLKRPDWFTAAPLAPRRAASLRSRVHESPLPGWAWPAAWVVWAGSAIALVALSREMPWPGPALTLGMGLAGGLWLAFGHFATRWFLLEPEPLDAGGSAPLQAAYATLRRFKVWCWYALVCGAMAVFTGVGLLNALGADVTLLVGLGAGGGALLGVAGGATGTYGSVLRGRIVELRRRVEIAG